MLEASKDTGHTMLCLSFCFAGWSGGLGRDKHSLCCGPGTIGELRSEDSQDLVATCYPQSG